MKWREITQFSQLLSSQSSVNNANGNNNKNQQQGQKTLSFTSKTQTILRQSWDSKFVFTKRSLVSYLRGRNIKSPDQNGRKPPAVIKGYLAFQNERIVQMFVSQMIARQIFIQKRIQTSGKRAKNIIIPMSSEQFHLVKNSNLRSKLNIEIPLSVIMNEEIKQKCGSNKQLRFSQFLHHKKQKNGPDKFKQKQEIFQGNSDEEQIVEVQQSQLEGQRMNTNLQTKQCNMMRIQPKANQLFFNSKYSSKVGLMQNAKNDQKSKQKQKTSKPLIKQKGLSQQQLISKRQEQKMKQFWQRQNKQLFQQFGQVKQQIVIMNKEIPNENKCKQSMVQMIKQIKQKDRVKKVNIPSQLFKMSETKRNTNNIYQRKQFIFQNQIKQSQSLKNQFYNNNQDKHHNQRYESKNQYNGQLVKQIQFKSPKHSQNSNQQQLQIQNLNQSQIFDYIFSNNQNISKPQQIQSVVCQQSKTITIDNCHHKMEEKRRSSANSSHSGSVRLKQYFDNGQIGKFWDQIFENPKFNPHLNKINNHQSQCKQIIEESQNTQTMSIQRPHNQVLSFNPSCLNKSYQQQNNSITRTIFRPDLNRSYPEQENHMEKIQKNNNFVNNFNNSQINFDNRQNNQQVWNSFPQENNNRTSSNSNNLYKNNLNQIDKFSNDKNPYFNIQQDSNCSDSFDRTITIAVKKENNKSCLNNNIKCYQRQINSYYNNSNYQPEKLQIEYPPQISQVQRSTYTLTVGQRHSDAFYYSPPKIQQRQSFFHPQSSGRQSFCDHTVTITRNPFLKQIQHNGNGFQIQKPKQSNSQYQNYQRYRCYDPVQQLDI